MEALEPRAMLAADLNAWHNPSMALDVNDDQIVDMVDVDVMLTQLKAGNRSFAESFQAAGGLEGEQVLYLDVNNDGEFNPLDLNVLITSLLEAEAADKSYSAAFDFAIFQNNVLVGQTSTSFDGNQDPVSTPVSVTVDQSVFTLVVYIRNSSVDTMGNLQSPEIRNAFVDIGYDPSFVTPNGNGDVGAAFQETIIPTVGPPGRLENAGGFSSVPENSGTLNGGSWEQSQILYSIDFTPTQTGSFMFESFFAERIINGEDMDPSNDINDAAILYNNLFSSEDTPLDVVNIAFPKLNITINAVPGANNDVEGASADLIEEVAAGDPRVIEISGVNYLVIDAKANDTDFSNAALPAGATAHLSSTVTAVTSLTTDADLVNRVMLATDPIAALPTLSNEYYLYRLPTDLSGPEIFEYTLSDGVNSTTATVTINISPLVVAVEDGTNTLPFATVTPGQQVTLDVLANDYIIGDGLDNALGLPPGADVTIVSVAGAAFTEGRLEIAADGKSLLYTGGATLGLETFDYTVSYVDDDQATHVSTATVTIRIPIDSLISGGFYFDVNNDHAWNDNAANNASPEQFIGGLQVSLYQGAALIGTAFSSEADGSFNFAGVDAGTYTVKIEAPKFVYKYGTGMGGVLPPNTSVDANGTITISNITIDSGNLKQTAFNLGFIGRTAAYRGPNDSISHVGETSILFAVSKQPGNNGKLEWYSPDQGWGELVQVKGFLFNTASKTGQAVLLVDHDNDPLTAEMSAPITFSLNDPNFLLIADTSDAVIFRLIGSIETIVDRLSNVDIAFSQI